MSSSNKESSLAQRSNPIYISSSAAAESDSEALYMGPPADLYPRNPDERRKREVLSYVGSLYLWAPKLLENIDQLTIPPESDNSKVRSVSHHAWRLLAVDLGATKTELLEARDAVMILFHAE